MADGLTEEALERIKFSFSSKNAENTVAPCLVQIYVSEDHTGPIVWQQVTSGVVALLRNKESTKKGWLWNISVAIADRYHGMCVWKDKLTTESGYTALSDNFHVFAVSNIQAIVAFVFEAADHGRNFAETYKEWALDKKRDDGSKGKVQASRRFTRELISRPCNFQHISGSAALAQIQQMEDAKQAVGRVIATIGPRRAVPLDSIDGDGGGKRKKKTQARPDRPSRFENMNLPMPGDNCSGLDLAYSQEPSSVRGSTPSVAMPDTIVEEQQQPVVVQSNGINHHQVDHQVSSSSLIVQQQNYQQYPDQNTHQTVQYQHQNVQHQDQAAQYQDQNTQYHNQNAQYYHGQKTNHYQQSHQDHNQYQNGQQHQQTQYQQNQPQYQHNQPQTQYQPSQDQVQEVQYRDRSQRHQPNQHVGATYQVEDIGYDYDDGAVEQSEDVWRESVMEGTNWEDEVLQAISMRTGGSAFVASEYL
ncbi:histone-lysine N-methyltransferase 2D-like [Dysidea avara]|uniref:histone-lysine N-methyltransferase 2D-like n=1 Tax=Dysidea avara TaxID=196820 RepID=UPI00332BB3F4